MPETQMMDGVWSAKQFITNYLALDIPERLLVYRNRWQIDDVRLPNPERYLAYEPPGLDMWPSIYTIQTNTANIERADFTVAGDPIYRVTYNMRTYVWVRDVGITGGEAAEHQVTEARDRLTTVVRSAMLDHPSMQRSESIYFPSLHVDVLMDETTLREEYSDITTVKGDRAVAGAYLSYEFSCHEVIPRTRIRDQVANFDVETVPLPWPDMS